MTILTKAVGDAHTAMLLHGPGGMFNSAGLENPFLTTVVKPKGIGQYLPAIATVDTDPLYGLVTEIVDDGANDPDYLCSDAATASMKSGVLSTVFGRLQTATKDIDLGTIALKLSNADRTDLQLLGGLLPSEDAGSGYPNNVNESNVLNNAIQAEMVTASWLMSSRLNRMVWEGDPANATANGGYVPFNGLSKLIKTGYVDARTGNVLPPADSTVVDGGWGEVGVDYDIANVLRDLMGYLEDLADGTVDGAQFALVMRPKMWEAISDVWSTQYANEITSQVGAASASRLMLDASSLTAQRDAMKGSRLLPIGSKVYPVVLDHGIAELTNADDGTNIALGKYSSSIYVVPLQIGPGMPVLYWEYLDWGVSAAMLNQAGFSDSVVFWTDGGRFIWTLDQNKLCIKLQTRVEPRIVLRTPQLAARIDDLLVTPGILRRQPHADDDGYVAGGETTRPGPVNQGP